MTNVKTNQILTLYQKDAVKMSYHVVDPVSSKNTYFKDISNENRINFVHKESDFNDFEQATSALSDDVN